MTGQAADAAAGLAANAGVRVHDVPVAHLRNVLVRQRALVRVGADVAAEA